MKRILVLLAVLALLAAGTVSVLADPINVGGEFTTASFSPINVGGENIAALAKVPAHAVAKGLRAKAGVTPILLCSPINVGGE